MKWNLMKTINSKKTDIKLTEDNWVYMTEVEDILNSVIYSPEENKKFSEYLKSSEKNKYDYKTI